MIRTLVQAWFLLLMLSLSATAISLVDLPTAPNGAGLAILVLSAFKARIILRSYLGLAQAPSWRGGTDAVLVLLALLYAGLFLAARP